MKKEVVGPGPLAGVAYVVMLNECAHGVQTLSLDRIDADGLVGTRFTSGKCCGRWTEARRWPMTLRQLLDAERLFGDAASELENE